MPSESCHINLAGEKIILLPERAIYWERKKMLLLSDLHLGKSAHFRKAGIAVSSDIHANDLSRLSRVLEQCTVQRICFIGDLFHSIQNKEWLQLRNWRSRHATVKLILIKGNHDIVKDEIVTDHGIDEVCYDLAEPPFRFIHEFTEEGKTDGYVLSGHLHPAVKLSGKGRQSAVLPCFWFRKNYGVLPAWGNFTGRSVIHPNASDDVYVIMNNSVIKFKN